MERDGDGLLYICWFDKKQVNLISSIHNTMMFRKTVRTKSTTSHHREVDKPAAIQLYSQYMQGVDRSDQLLWYNLSRHRQQKWWKKLFVYLLEVCHQCRNHISSTTPSPEVRPYKIPHECCTRTAGRLRATSHQSWSQDVAATTRSTDREAFPDKCHHHHLQWQPLPPRLRSLFRSESKAAPNSDYVQTM